MAFGRRKVQIAVGTATASDVLSGFTFSSAGAGVNADGAMTNEGSPTLQPGASIAAGYYSGGSAASPGSGSQSYTTPGTYTFTVPSGVTRLFISAMSGGGGGGGGGGSYAASANQPGAGGGGGGAGAWAIAFLDVSAETSLQIIVGAGGVGGGGGSPGDNGSDGGGGGSTSIGSFFLPGDGGKRS